MKIRDQNFNGVWKCSIFCLSSYEEYTGYHLSYDYAMTELIHSMRQPVLSVSKSSHCSLRPPSITGSELRAQIPADFTRARRSKLKTSPLLDTTPIIPVLFSQLPEY